MTFKCFLRFTIQISIYFSQRTIKSFKENCRTREIYINIKNLQTGLKIYEIYITTRIELVLAFL